MIIVVNILIEEFSIPAPVVSVIGLCDAILYKAAVLVFKLHLMTKISFSITSHDKNTFQITSQNTNICDSDYSTNRLSDGMIRNIFHRCGRSSLSRPPLGRRFLVWRYIFFLFFALPGEYFLSKKSSLTIFICPSLATTVP